MPEASPSLAYHLHPGRDLFPERAFEVLQELTLEPDLLAFSWELADWPKGFSDAERRDLLVIALVLLATEAQGHARLRVPLQEGGFALQLLTRLGRKDLDLERGLARFEQAGMLGAPGEARPFIREESWLYTQRMHALESDLQSRIAELQTLPPIAATLPEALLGDPVVLNGEQVAGVRMALERPLALITGGPGTGKTSIVVAILRALLHQPGMRLEDIALAAPTGKAAQRMGEAIRTALGRVAERGAVEQAIADRFPEPQTLHRLLAWHPIEGRFRHDQANPLSAKVAIVDEASMISLEHMDRLLRALPEGGRLVLLGDADQLPSVEPGRAFRDLVECLTGSCVRLLTSYRMSEADPEGRNILSVASVVNAPTSGSLWEGPEPVSKRAGPQELQFAKVELLPPTRDHLEAFFRGWFDRQVLGLPGFAEKAMHVFDYREGWWSEEDAGRLKELFDHFDRFRILAALREAPELRGVAEINAQMHRWMASTTGKGLKFAVPFHAGEPVLQTTNDYRRRIYNGDQGLVLRVRFRDGDDEQAAVFPRVEGPQAFPLEPLRHQLELCYAMTVHKSQGSEYERIALVLPKTNHRALTRELVYTALTRAKKSVVLLTEPERLSFAMGHPTERESGLAERLVGGKNS